MTETCDRCGAEAAVGVNGPRNHRDVEECLQAVVDLTAALDLRIRELERREAMRVPLSNGGGAE